LLHSIVISLVSECHHHPSMMHLSTHQVISLGQKVVHVHHLEKHLMEQIVYTFLAKKNTNCFVAIKSSFVFSSTVTTNIHKTLQPTNNRAEHVYIISRAPTWGSAAPGRVEKCRSPHHLPHLMVTSTIHM